MVKRNQTFNYETMQWEKCEEYLYNPCGSDYGAFIHDLKTIAGVKKRLQNWKWRKDVEQVNIYTCGNNQFSDSDRRLVAEIKDIKRMNF
jgi:hypothetical protein